MKCAKHFDWMIAFSGCGAKVEKIKKCLVREDQVDICENLILMCQSLYSRKEINATT